MLPAPLGICLVNCSPPSPSRSPCDAENGVSGRVTANISRLSALGVLTAHLLDFKEALIWESKKMGYSLSRDDYTLFKVFNLGMQ